MPSSEWLVAALVERLSRAVPPEFEVQSDHGVGVRISALNDFPFYLTQGVAPILDQDGPPEDLIETAAWSVLSGVQDFIAEHTALPWPGERTMPLPEARVLDGALRLWFDSDGSRVLELEPIPIPL